MKIKTLITIIITIVSLATITVAVRALYLEHFKYRSLTKEIREIHQKMEKDLPKELVQQKQPELAIVRFSFPSSYGVGENGAEITKEFEKAGILPPQDQWMIVKETFIRSKVGKPFKIHRLITLENEVYKTKSEKKALKAITNEFYVYREFKGKMD